MKIVNSITLLASRRVSAAVRCHKKFNSDERGSVAMIFALSIIVLCGMIAFAVDVSRTMAVRQKLQAAVDAAVLAANPLGTQSPGQVQDNVTAVFNSNMPGEYGDMNVIVDPPLAIANGYQVTAHADVPMTFGQILGVNVISVNALAQAVRAQHNLEVSLVLDNTFSMNGQRIADLQTAANQLIDEIVGGMSGTAAVKFALVPFSNYVNVGLPNRNAPWMSVPADYTQTVSGSYQTTDWAGCPTTTTTYTCYNDGVPQTCSSTQCTTPGPVHTVNYSYPVTHTWNGCAGSRAPAPDLNVSATFGAPIPGILDVGCPSPLTRLTTDSASIKTQINAMIAQGETYIPSGLMWGWRALDPGPPFADAAPYSVGSNATKKIMILMTDGFNTRSQGGNIATDHEGWNAPAADAAMGQLCTKVKATGIELYTIDYQVNNPAAQALLQACATDTGHYFNAQDSAALQAAFTSIAGTIIRLALSK